MSTINVGPGAIDRDWYISREQTYIDKNNPANDGGHLHTVEIWAYSPWKLTNCKIGTFYGSGLVWTCRDYAVIGDVPAGSKQTFSDLNIEVRAGDLLGIYFEETSPVEHSFLECDASGYAGILAKIGDHFSDGAQTYTPTADYALSIYGTGITELPVVTTQVATDVGENQALGNGNITHDGGVSVIQHGVCWKKGADPVNLAGAEGYTEEGAGSEGSFTSTLSPLFEDTLYYYRAYATNSEGDGYGAAQTFKTEYRARSIII